MYTIPPNAILSLYVSWHYEGAPGLRAGAEGPNLCRGDQGGQVSQVPHRENRLTAGENTQSNSVYIIVVSGEK